jgi:DNA-binding NarL/FixJ family response regulator
VAHDDHRHHLHDQLFDCLLKPGQKYFPMVILDISMAHMGGREAAGEIKKNYPEIKVLILSMYNDKEYMNPALAKVA